MWKYYWALIDAWKEVSDEDPPSTFTNVSLIWREFFYAMSATNPFYGEMERNPICVNIPWFDNQEHLQAYLSGNTGFPFIDAGVRQMKKEGWTHHIVRNALSIFLTRGDLWLSWEHGLKFFLNYMIGRVFENYIFITFYFISKTETGPSVPGTGCGTQARPSRAASVTALIHVSTGKINLIAGRCEWL